MSAVLHPHVIAPRLLRATFFLLSTLLPRAIFLLAQPVAPHPSPETLLVDAGKSIVLDSAQPVKRIAIGAPELAEASAISRTEILINGKTAGETSLIVWDAEGARRYYTLTVTSSQLTARQEAARHQLAIELPSQKIQLSAEGETIFLRGTVSNLNSSDRAERIAATAGKVVNLLQVKVPDADPQILLKVHFASIDLNKSKQMGMNFFSTGAANTIGSITTGQFAPPALSSTGGVTTVTLTDPLSILVESPGKLPLGVDIKALESKGVAQVLAEPNLLAANGRQASFLAGGEYPYPVVQGGTGSSSSSVTIMFKEYGVRLNFIPTITPRGTIRLQVAPEVSALDFSNAITISGFTIPAITSRKVNTEVELADGQSFVLGGLLDNRTSETLQKIPFLGDVPVLGKFFKSVSTNKTNTELIVIVTPEIVAPIPAGTPLPKLDYPEKFLPKNSAIPMNTPDEKTRYNTPAPALPAIPVEKLVYSMRPETPLVLDEKQAQQNSSPPSGFTSSSAPK